MAEHDADEKVLFVGASGDPQNPGKTPAQQPVDRDTKAETPDVTGPTGAQVPPPALPETPQPQPKENK